MSSFIDPFLKLGISAAVLTFIVWFSSGKSIYQNPRKEALENALVDRFNQAGFIFEIDSIRRILFGALFIGFIFGLLISPVVAIVLPLGILVSVWLFLGQRAKSQLKLSERVNDEVCFFLSRNLRAGHSLDSGIIAAAQEFPGSKVVTSIVRYLKGGTTLLGAIETISMSENQMFDSAEKTLCATISLAQEMGGNSARVFDRIGDNFHQSYELGEDTNSALAQVRMSVYVIGFLPVVMFGFSFLLGSDSAMFLVTSPIGWICLVLGSLLEIAGVMWMKKMVDSGVKIWNF